MDKDLDKILKEEKLIDPGNEHHHGDENKSGTKMTETKEDTDKNTVDEKKAGENADIEPGEGEMDEADTSGEDG